MNIKNTNLCPLCKTNIETINHTFLECNFVVILWNDIEKWVKKSTKQTVKFSNIDRIFGTQTSDKLIDKIILNAKTVIFNNREMGKFTISMMLKEDYTGNYVKKNIKRL